MYLLELQQYTSVLYRFLVRLQSQYIIYTVSYATYLLLNKLHVIGQQIIFPLSGLCTPMPATEYLDIHTWAKLCNASVHRSFLLLVHRKHISTNITPANIVLHLIFCCLLVLVDRHLPSFLQCLPQVNTHIYDDHVM